jgi:hypothetical protein
MIWLAFVMVAQTPTLPPCKSGAPTCNPWERAWVSDAGREKGPYNLILRWGMSAPISIHYETKARCELAAEDINLRDVAVDEKAVVSAPKPVDAVTAFCVPG